MCFAANLSTTSYFCIISSLFMSACSFICFILSISWSKSVAVTVSKHWIVPFSTFLISNGCSEIILFGIIVTFCKIFSRTTCSRGKICRAIPWWTASPGKIFWNSALSTLWQVRVRFLRIISMDLYISSESYDIDNIF